LGRDTTDHQILLEMRNEIPTKDTKGMKDTKKNIMKEKKAVPTKEITEANDISYEQENVDAADKAIAN
jgi:hypothetical protein